jgi:hypothetical protein
MMRMLGAKRAETTKNGQKYTVGSFTNCYSAIIFFVWRYSPHRSQAVYLLYLLDHTQLDTHTHTHTQDRNPLNEYQHGAEAATFKHTNSRDEQALPREDSNP